jgi:hypothetical protein
MSSEMYNLKHQRIQMKYDEEKQRNIINATEDINNITIQAQITSIDYISTAQYSMYIYNARITKETCGLPTGFKIKIVNFNESLGLEKKEYVIKHLKFNHRYCSFNYINKLTFHYLADDKKLEAGANYVKITQFF